MYTIIVCHDVKSLKPGDVMPLKIKVNVPKHTPCLIDIYAYGKIIISLKLIKETRFKQ